jgi:hypothetical protein
MKRRRVLIATTSIGLALCLGMFVAYSTAAPLDITKGPNGLSMNRAASKAQQHEVQLGRYQGMIDSENCPWLFDTATGACWQGNIAKISKPPEGVEWKKVVRPLPQSN